MHQIACRNANYFRGNISNSHYYGGRLERIEAEGGSGWWEKEVDKGEKKQ
jgi:hypothetical protein